MVRQRPFQPSKWYVSKLSKAITLKYVGDVEIAKRKQDAAEFNSIERKTDGNVK